MIKLLGSTAALLAIVLLMSVGSVSARTGGTFVPIPGSSGQIKAVASTVNPSPVLAIWSNPLHTDGEDGHQYGYGNGNENGNGNGNENNYGNHNGDKNEGGKGRKDRAPAPEPSTILSFGAALLIGGGVLYSRRLRRKRN
jgi:hypothetical protein